MVKLAFQQQVTLAAKVIVFPFWHLLPKEFYMTVFSSCNWIKVPLSVLVCIGLSMYNLTEQLTFKPYVTIPCDFD